MYSILGFLRYLYIITFSFICSLFVPEEKLSDKQVYTTPEKNPLDFSKISEKSKISETETANPEAKTPEILEDVTIFSDSDDSNDVEDISVKDILDDTDSDISMVVVEEIERVKV